MSNHNFPTILEGSLCQPIDFKNAVQQILEPVWIATGFSVYNLYHAFMPMHIIQYNNNGCQWFQTKVTAWQANIAGLSNPSNVQGQRLQAKILWAQHMHTSCGCSGPPPQLIADTNLNTKVVTNIDLDLSDIPAGGETRAFNVIGTANAEFDLEIKNKSGNYYNFTTNTFTAAKSSFKKDKTNTITNGLITFPNIATTDTVNGAVTSGVKVVMDTVVANTMAVGDRVTGNTALNAAHVTVAALNPDGDNTSEFSLSTAIAIADGVTLTFTGDNQYDVSLIAKPGTVHAEYIEKRFGDNSIDLNSSTGSNSLLMKKVIYQYAEVLLTMSMYSAGATMTPSANTNDTLNISRGKGTKIPFTISSTSASTESFTIIRQPLSDDVLAFVTPTVGSAPETLPGENIYPAVSNTDTVNGEIAGGSSTIKVVMDTNVADKMAVGDKITAAVATDTVDGAVESGSKVVMDNNVAGKMSVGDQVTGNAFLDANIVRVSALNPDGDNVKEFTMSEAVAILDGVTLTFSPECNRSLTTVVALNPDTDNVKEFSMSQNIGFINGVTLSFSNQMNFQWPLDSINKVTEGMIVVPGTNVTTDTRVGKYEDTVTIFENTDKEEIIVKNSAPATTTKNQTPTITKGLITTQLGNVVFDKQQKLALAGDVVKIGGYGTDEILRVYGWDLIFTDLELTLTAVTTTTTAAAVGSTSVVLAARDGILNGTSTVSGIGIDPLAAAPTVNSGASATGAGTVVLSAAQSLENGITLTFAGAGKIATVTGNIEVLKTGTANQTLRFDIDKFLTSA